MNLSELKSAPISHLVEIAKENQIDNIARLRKEEIIFALLKTHARKGEDIYGEGVLEILRDGFGFIAAWIGIDAIKAAQSSGVFPVLWVLPV